MSENRTSTFGALSAIPPKTPNCAGWISVNNPNTHELDKLGYPHKTWVHNESGLFAISAVEVAREPGEVDLGPEYHLSISLRGQRCTAADALFVLAAFGLMDAKEDNHVPGGRVRNFWRPVADH
ncbi:MAG: hypothetical protein EOO23_08895, partial [Comamonadaceae bacterium]